MSNDKINNQVERVHAAIETNLTEWRYSSDPLHIETATGKDLDALAELVDISKKDIVDGYVGGDVSEFLEESITSKAGSSLGQHNHLLEVVGDLEGGYLIEGLASLAEITKPENFTQSPNWIDEVVIRQSVCAHLNNPTDEEWITSAEDFSVWVKSV